MITRRGSSGRSISFLLILVVGLLSAVRLATIAADEESPPANPQPAADHSDSGKAKSGNVATTSIAAPEAVVPQSADKPTAAKAPVAVVKNNPASVADLLAIQAGIEQAAAKGSPATVGISIGGFFGSGVIVTEDGYILTAGHVAGARATRRRLFSRITNGFVPKRWV